MKRSSLKGARILTTVARGKRGGVSALLRKRGARPLEVEAVALAPLPDLGRFERAMAALERYQWVVLTSAYAAELFAAKGPSALKSVGAKGPAMVAVGPRTAFALKKRAFSVRNPKRADGTEGLLDWFRKKKRGFVLLPRARAGRRDLAQGLRRLGFRVSDIPIYETRPRRHSWKSAALPLRLGRLSALGFTSPSAVQSFFLFFGSKRGTEILSKIPVLAIGKATQNALIRKRFRKGRRAPAASAEGMLEGFEKICEENEKAKKR